MAHIRRIGFVCLGNIGRSPLAEHLFRHLARQMGLDAHYETTSAGTSSRYIGYPYDEHMVRLAAQHGVQYQGFARQFQRRELESLDLILAMDGQNWAVLTAMAYTPDQQEKIRLLREFDPQGGKFAAVPDPYLQDQEKYEEVYDMIARSVLGLLEALEQSVV
jgi:low molecular weight protein-tyrosine phosphatase